jgi:hypothetical protein
VWPQIDILLLHVDSVLFLQIQVLSKSINVDSDLNWFAYTTRMHVGLHIADTVIKHNQDKAKTSLENAKKDGHISSKSKNTRRNVTIVFCFFKFRSIVT